ncbi:hypothetical protein EMIHUDRAFT_456906, partial [Emiliania huxleyi CCMP1516]
ARPLRARRNHVRTARASLPAVPAKRDLASFLRRAAGSREAAVRRDGGHAAILWRLRHHTGLRALHSQVEHAQRKADRPRLLRCGREPGTRHLRRPRSRGAGPAALLPRRRLARPYRRQAHVLRQPDAQDGAGDEVRLKCASSLLVGQFHGSRCRSGGAKLPAVRGARHTHVNHTPSYPASHGKLA